MPLVRIQFKELSGGVDREIGQAMLNDDGSVRLSGLPAHIAKDLRENGALGFDRKRYTLKDGAKFLIACIAQFSGGYVRAVAVRDKTLLSPRQLSAAVEKGVHIALGKRRVRKRIERDEHGNIIAIVEEPEDLT